MTIIWLLVGLGLIVLGADWLVDGASSIARKAGVSEFVIGLTIVGFGTSCPELVVSLTGALEGNADIAIGNVIGSNFFDAASVFSILMSKKLGLKNNTAPILEMESGSNDPFSYMLTALMLSILNGKATGLGISWMLFAQLAFGAGCGVLIAKVASWILDRFRIKGEGFDSLFILSVAILSYAIPDLIGGNGYLSTYIVGIMLGNSDFPGEKALVNFFDGITGLMQVLIFFLLGLLARPALLHKAVPFSCYW